MAKWSLYREFVHKLSNIRISIEMGIGIRDERNKEMRIITKHKSRNKNLRTVRFWGFLYAFLACSTFLANFWLLSSHVDNCSYTISIRQTSGTHQLNIYDRSMVHLLLVNFSFQYSLVCGWKYNPYNLCVCVYCFVFVYFAPQIPAEISWFIFYFVVGFGTRRKRKVSTYCLKMKFPFHVNASHAMMHNIWKCV